MGLRSRARVFASRRMFSGLAATPGPGEERRLHRPLRATWPPTRQGRDAPLVAGRRSAAAWRSRTSGELEAHACRHVISVAHCGKRRSQCSLAGRRMPGTDGRSSSVSPPRHARPARTRRVGRRRRARCAPPARPRRRGALPEATRPCAGRRRQPIQGAGAPACVDLVPAGMLQRNPARQHRSEHAVAQDHVVVDGGQRMEASDPQDRVPQPGVDRGDHRAEVV